MTMQSNPSLTPLDISGHQQSHHAWYHRLKWTDGAFACLMVLVFAYGWLKNHTLMDVYEQWILVGTVVSLIALGFYWRPLQWVFASVAGLSIVGTWVYAGQLARGETAFLLKYLLASQPAVMWMSVLFVLATGLYWLALIVPRAVTANWLASKFTFAGVVMGSVALMVRWYESYLIAPDVGHIPVSNLYEVFILFALLTAAFYLYYEDHYHTYQLGGFVMIIVVAAIGFLLWYSFERGQHEIKPLIPALQSWWMKIHVPANFVGYGTFSIAAMVGLAYLIKHLGTPLAQMPAGYQASVGYSSDASAQVQTLAQQRHDNANRRAAVSVWLLGAALFLLPMAMRRGVTVDYVLSYWSLYFGIGLVLIGAILLARRTLASRLPDFALLDDVMYKAIAVGFVFFTIATILGAFWAADAWGKYWSWDPKEYWALVVWLNYAAWLHLRLMRGMRGAVSALWALIGLLITSFAFMGVNMFLSGLHSYGQL